MIGETSISNSEVAFKIMEDGFAQASDAYPNGIFESSYTFAGQTVLFRITGRKLAEHIHQPFAHLLTDDIAFTPSRLTIELWDQRETGILFQTGSVSDDLILHPIHTKSSDGQFTIHRTQHTIICFNRGNGHIIGCVLSAKELSLYERGRPLHVPLTSWHNEQNVPVVHAGLVSLNGQGVLFAGSGGTGKSTSAITCLCAGFRYLSDDLIGLQVLADGSLRGHSLYNSTYLDRDHLVRFPLLKPHAIKSKYPFEEKLLVLLSQVLPTRLTNVSNINVIVLPRIVQGAKARIRPAPKAKALFALAPSSLAINTSLGAHGFNKLVQLVERVPCYWLELGRDLDGIPNCVEELLA